LPIHPEDLKTEFFLFHRAAQQLDAAEALNYKSARSLDGTGFDPALPLKLVVHGFSNNRSTDWVTNLARALLAKVNIDVDLIPKY
jgi:hypothetical protein